MQGRKMALFFKIYLMAKEYYEYNFRNDRSIADCQLSPLFVNSNSQDNQTSRQVDKQTI
jgi:hypothetical protein